MKKPSPTPLVLIGLLSLYAWTGPPAGAQGPVHFTDCVARTGASATVVVPVSSTPDVEGTSLAPGSEVAVFSPDGLCTGQVVWEGFNNSFEVWGDDAQTPEVDGMRAGEPLHFRVWDGAEAYAGDAVQVSYEDRPPPYSSDGTYGDDKVFVLRDLSVVRVPNTTATESLPDAVQRYEQYPNPFQNETTITFDLVQSAYVTLVVYDLQGRVIATLLAGRLAAGRHPVRWQARGVPRGMYLCRLFVGSRSLTHPLIAF